MPRQKVTIAPEVSTDVMKAEAIALVQQWIEENRPKEATCQAK